MNANTPNKDDLLVFAEEKKQSGGSQLQPWKILIVDDEVDVHKVTRLVLSGFEFAEKPVEFLSCYSGNEAKDMLRLHPDIAIVLLDVVMEETDSGLKLVEYIRKELNNRYLRIILRTGQPGQAPERQVILQYDINDYKSKIELTSEKLLTSVISCLRSYMDMITIERNRRGLEKIVIAADDIFQMQSMDDFLAEIVRQISLIITNESSLEPVSVRGVCAVREGAVFVVKAVTGTLSSDLKGKDVQEALSPGAMEIVSVSVRERLTVYEKGIYAGFYRASNGIEHIICMEKDLPFDEWEKDLVEIFSANVMTAFENLYLNLDLEKKVEVRTSELQNAKNEIESAMHELEIINEKLTVTNHELEAAKAVADQDMRMAINVQENFLPQNPPVSPVWELSYYFQPMAGISGDFYDFYVDEAGHPAGLSLFDVSGHGIASGLITMLAKSITYRRFKSMKDRPLSDVIDAVNDDLISELDNVPNFLSGIMFRFDTTSAEYVNAGHPDIIIRKAADGKTYSFAEEADNPKGFYLGINSMKMAHRSTKIGLSSGDFLFAFSDCLIEGCNADNVPFGIAQLTDVVSSMNSAMSTQNAIDEIMRRYWEHTGTDVLPDDITLVAVKKLS